MTKYNLVIVLLLFINVVNENLTNGVYQIKYHDLYLNFHQKNNLFYFARKSSLSKKSLFRIYNELDKNTSYFLFESLEHNKKIYSEKNKVLADTKFDNSSKNFFWSFINNNTNSVVIKNINGCYIHISSFLTITCIDSFQNASQFYFIKIYEEVNHTEEDIKLIEKEPIDILIKYIDLNDPNLTRKGIHQIKKDIDNEEIKYSIRSILKNIPWIRKIFILMPNEKVRYFKEPGEIKEKIIYVKDKDLIGFDSSSSLVFQFRYWKMKNFNISDNFLALDDDCFIGKPLRKTDFFYVKNKTVLPLIINSKLLEFKKAGVESNIYYYKRAIKKTKQEQGFNEFQYTKQLTYLFIMNALSRKKIIVPKFTHNAIPINVNELKEIYELIDKSKFKETTLYSTYRHKRSLQFQTFYLGYTFNKYQKKIHNIPHKLIRFQNTLHSRFDYALFCINTNAHQNSGKSKKQFLIKMEKLFPEKSPYEIIENSRLSISIKSIKQLKDEIKMLQKKLTKLKKQDIKSENLKKNSENYNFEFNLKKDKLGKNNSKIMKIHIYSLALLLVLLLKVLIYFKIFYFL